MLTSQVLELNSEFAWRTAPEIVMAVLLRPDSGHVAAVSSFGAGSAVLLHMIAAADPQTPVLFLDTGMHFPETLAYRDALVTRLRLQDVRNLRPDPDRIAALDAPGTLWRSDPDACCEFRKVHPLAEALSQFDTWLTGRRRGQAETRTGMPIFEILDGRIKVNPLAAWSSADVESYMEEHRLPRHPLVMQGYPSIGCAVCTDRVREGGNARSGRWRGRAKTECGIHFGKNGAVARGA